MSTGSAADAGLQVGPGFEVDRELELAAAFTIDAGNAATDELRARERVIQDLLDAYFGTW